MSVIRIKVVDQVLTIMNAPMIAAGDINTDFIIFTFDSAWDGYGKNAIFYRDDNRENVYEVALDGNGKAVVPKEVVATDGKIWVGVVGVNGSNVLTSEVIWYEIVDGFYSASLGSESAEANIYSQMLTVAGQMEELYNSVKKEQQNEFEKLFYLYYPRESEYVTINNLIDLSVDETYALFDNYVTDKILTKKIIGYASSSTEGDAVEDTTLPIYMYSYRNKMTKATGYMTSGYAKPILLTNAIHGNEKMGVPVMLTMLKAYKEGNSPRITKLFNDYGIDFVPILNPYGYNAAIGTTMETVESNIGRLNARGVDLNRNGVTCWKTTHDTTKGNSSLSECESKAIHEIAVENGGNYSFHIDLHTERYDETKHDYFGVLGSGSSVLRSIFSVVMANMNERMKSVYDYDMLDELNEFGITGNLSRMPMLFIDRCYKLDTHVASCLYEAPRYNGEEIYPIKSQKFTCDIVINFLIKTMDFLKSYMTLYRSIDRAYIKNKIFQKDILPTTKDGWEYGLAQKTREWDSAAIIRTVNKIPVDGNTYYDIVPSYDNLFYSVRLSDNDDSNVKFIDWQNGQTRIYTEEYTHIRFNLAIGDPNNSSSLDPIIMPSLWHDYDIVMTKV